MFNVIVLASGRGSNFAALLTAQQRGDLPVRIAGLLSDRAHASVLAIARAAQIPAIALKPRDYPDRLGFDKALFDRAAEFQPDLIILAGYMRVIDADVVRQWRGRMINIHPSLLPKYTGLHTHERAIAAGDTLHGSSVHYVSAELDGGPVIAQAELPIAPEDSADTLAARLLPLEHHLLTEVVGLIASQRIVLGDEAVEFDGQPIAAPLKMNADGMLDGM